MKVFVVKYYHASNSFLVDRIWTAKFSKSPLLWCPVVKCEDAGGESTSEQLPGVQATEEPSFGKLISFDAWKRQGGAPGCLVKKIISVTTFATVS
jgi:hypothetical protein